MNYHQKHLSACLIALAALVSMAPIQGAWAAGLLGSAASFAVLGDSTVTNTGATVVTGNLGLSPPGVSVTGFELSPTNTIVVGPSPATGVTPGLGIVTGTIYVGDPVATQAHKDAVIAYAALLGQTCTTANNLSGMTLGTTPGAVTLPPGVYCFDSSAQLTGTLTLTGAGPWIFKIGSTLTTAAGSSTASGSSVVISGSGQAGGVFWQVGSSATVGTYSQFIGNILAEASITLGTSASVSGSALALTGAVTMDTNNVSVNASVPVPVGSPPFCAPPKLSCDTNHQHHKNCKLHDYDPPHCDGNDDGHDGNQKSWSSNPWSNDKH